MEIKDYSEVYQCKTDDELLLIAACAHQLVPEANAALSGEMTRRGLNQQTLQGRVMEWREQWKKSREEVEYEILGVPCGVDGPSRANGLRRNSDEHVQRAIGPPE